MAAKPGITAERHLISTDSGGVPVATYRPAGAGPLPVLVYFPGGRFRYRFSALYDAFCSYLAAACECVVVCADYRLAPAAPFPAAPNDCYEALRWVSLNAASFGGDPRCIVVGGDSAGATLAAVVCLMAKDRGGPSIAGQILAYPFLGGDMETPSRLEFGNVADFINGWRAYTPRPEDASHPWATPANAPSLEDLPPALIFTGACAPLRDEGESFAAKLSADGNGVAHFRIANGAHGFLTSLKPEDEDIRQAVVKLIAAEIRKRFISAP